MKFATLSLTVCSILLPTLASADFCTEQMPKSLVEELGAKFPEYRWPLASDNDPDYVEWSRREGGKGCWGVAIADFDGKDGQDFLLALTARKGQGALFVVALGQGGHWELKELGRRAEGRSALYVAAKKAGTYKRSSALEGALEQGEVSALRCPHAAAEVGKLESAAAVYCQTSKGWQHTWVSD